MNIRRSYPVLLAGLVVLAGSVVALLGFGPLNLPAFDPFKEGVWGGMATQLMQARSLAYDGDLRYTERDIQRWYDYHPVEQGPRGLYLKRSAAGRYYYASPLLYALVTAPFVRVADYHGLLLVNAILLAVMVWMLAGWWRRVSGPWRAAVFALAVVGFSHAPAYLFVMGPDLLWATLLGGGLILVLRSIERPRPIPLTPSVSSEASGVEPAVSYGAGVLRIPWAPLVLGAIMLGLAAYEKPLFALFAGCVLVQALVSGGWKPLVVAAAVTVAAWLAPTALHLAQDGTVSPYLGDRRQYVRGVYPLTDRREDFSASWGDEEALEDGGIGRRLSIVPRGNLGRTAAIAGVNLPLNLCYFLAGRQTGLAAYSPGILVCVVLFMVCKGRRHVASILAALVLYVLFYLLARPNNYYGGGTSLGNRNVLHVLPALALLAPALPRPRWFAAALAPVVVLGALFLGPVMLRPRYAVLGHLNRMNRPGLVWLPIELTQARAMFSSPREVTPLPDGDRLYRLAGTRPSPTLGWVVAPDHTVRFVLETGDRARMLRLRAIGGYEGAEFLERRGLFEDTAGAPIEVLPAFDCAEVDIPVRGGVRVATEAGPRWMAEVVFYVSVPGGQEPRDRIAAGLQPAWPPQTFGWPSGTLRIGQPGDQRFLLWGWSSRLTGDDGATFRGADCVESLLLVYLQPGRDYVLELEGRSAIPHQEVRVMANQRDCGAVRLSPGWDRVRSIIPAAALDGEVAAIVLRHERLGPSSASVPHASKPATALPKPQFFAEYRKVRVVAKPPADAGP
ncbi:MAG: hypothetical protein AMS14_06745 [Planctomycetes bacterium DG_20]|nr:MAG: hypothetical protein AMS14_06745 [Planctomycetes bacterium DG_20]